MTEGGVSQIRSALELGSASQASPSSAEEVAVSVRGWVRACTCERGYVGVRVSVCVCVGGVVVTYAIRVMGN